MSAIKAKHYQESRDLSGKVGVNGCLPKIKGPYNEQVLFRFPSMLFDMKARDVVLTLSCRVSCLRQSWLAVFDISIDGNGCYLTMQG